jgi:hypothetical protein
MYLNEKIKKLQEIFYEVGPVSAPSDTCFLVQNRSFLNISTFHLEKLIKNVELCTIGAYILFLRFNYKTLKIRIFVEQSSWANSTMFF